MTASRFNPLVQSPEGSLKGQTVLTRPNLPPLAKSCVCHRSGKSPAKSNHCHTSKNPLLQVLCLPHLGDPPGGVRVCVAAWLKGRGTAAPSSQVQQNQRCVVGPAFRSGPFPELANRFVVALPVTNLCPLRPAWAAKWRQASMSQTGSQTGPPPGTSPRLHGNAKLS